MIYDLAIIGAGSGGLSVAAAAAQFGQKSYPVRKREDGRGLPELWLHSLQGAYCRCKTGPHIPHGGQIRNFGQ